MKLFKVLGLTLCVVCLIVATNILWATNDYAYSATCLESKVDDSKTFGKVLAVNKNYLAVGDPDANRVVIYQRQIDNNWLRTREIKAPQNSNAERIGYGFGADLALNEETLAIKAFALGWELENSGNQDLAEVYTVSLSEKNINSTPKKIRYPNPDKTSVDSISFLGKNIAFTARTIFNSQQKVNRVYVADSVSGLIIKSIEPLELQYTSKGTERFTSFYSELVAYQESLILGNLSGKWHNSLFRVYPNSDPEKVVFNPNQVNEQKLSLGLSQPGLTTFAISDELLAVGRNLAGAFDTLVFLGFPEISKFKSFPLTGILDAHKSYLLISHRTAPGDMPSYKEGQPDHTLIKVEDREIKVESVIVWERAKFDPSNYKSPFIEAIGSINDRGVFLTSNGKIVYLPFENLPQRYVINQSICKK